MSDKKNHICPVCKKAYPSYKLFPLQLIRPALLEELKKKDPEIDEQGYICEEDLQKLRSQYIENIIKEDKGEISSLEKEVLNSLKEQEFLTEDVNAQFLKQLTFGERLADKIAQFGGSWIFISIFIVFIAFWIGINIIFMQKPFDPYPFILLNLLLSTLAAIQAPVIMMSQNRQADKEKLKSDDDYRTNLKAELEIRLLHNKIDQLMNNQWERLITIQQIQTDIVEEILKKNKS